MTKLDELLQEAEITYALADSGCRINPEPLKKLIAIVKRQREAIDVARAHCEAIALSSLLPPNYGGEEFFQSQATKSVGSGGRSYHALKECLADVEHLAKEEK